MHAGLDRLDRDVFSQSGVRGVIVYDINDVAPPAGRTAEQVEADYRSLIRRSHARGIRVYCPTWAPDASLTTPTDERGKVNAWILNRKACDGVVDWDGVLRDPQMPATFRPDYFSDGMHPNVAGHRAIADATPLRWLRTCAGRRRIVLHVRGHARIFVDGRRVAVRHRRRVVLRHLRTGRTRVRIIRRGHVRVRSYRTCR